MAARLGNTANSRNQSMTEELFDLVRSEEYIEEIVMFEGTEYVNKLELSSLKKMISGKLWIDCRKFVSRQNNSITSGLFNLFSQTMGKSAVDVRNEASDFLLSRLSLAQTVNARFQRPIPSSDTDTAINWIMCFNATSVAKSAHSKVTWTDIKRSMMQKNHGIAQRMIVVETLNAKQNLSPIKSSTLANCLNVSTQVALTVTGIPGM